MIILRQKEFVQLTHYTTGKAIPSIFKSGNINISELTGGVSTFVRGGDRLINPKGNTLRTLAESDRLGRGINLRSSKGVSKSYKEKRGIDTAKNRAGVIDGIRDGLDVPARLTIDYVGNATKGTDLAEKLISNGKPIQFQKGEVKMEVPKLTNEDIHAIPAYKRKALRKFMKKNPELVNMTQETHEFMYGNKNPLVKNFKPESNADIPGLSTYVSDTVPFTGNKTKHYIGNISLAPSVVRPKQ